MNGIDTRKRETVSVTVRGKLLDCRTFDNRLEAASYKQACHTWAMKRGVVVEVWSNVERPRQLARARPALLAQAG